LYSVPVRFKNGRGDIIALDAVYQDTMPEGGEKAVLFGIHGSPGSHADFKYLAPELKRNGVRMVVPNFPGQGYTPGEFVFFNVLHSDLMQYERRPFSFSRLLQSLLPQLGELGEITSYRCKRFISIYSAGQKYLRKESRSGPPSSMTKGLSRF
uniref:AB hydrolase-1 domain-containing protein n=1 Tax=Haemonchus placei TaxID=6290 RepID=A0A0N4VZB7_HAEPC